MAGAGDSGAGSGAVRAGRAFVEFFAKDAALRRSMANLHAKFKQLGAMMLKVGGATALGGGLALKPVVQKFAEFDDAIRAVKAAVGATGAEFDAMRGKALELGRTTSFTAVDVAKLMLELGRAGFTADQINVMTKAVLDLARATGTDAALSAGIMSASIRQFGLDAEDAARVADILTAGANLSFNSVESLGEALKYVGPVAKGMGHSLEDTIAILGTLGNMGIQGSEAGTALRRILTGEGAKAADFMRIFGVNTVDAVGNVRSLVDVLDEVNASVAGMGNAAKAAKFEELFGLLGITSAVAISENAKGVRELRDQIAHAGGMAARTAEEMDAGLGGGMRRLKGAVEGVVLAFGDAFAPILLTVAQALQLGANFARNFIGENRELATTIAGATVTVIGIGAALAVLGITFGLLSAGVSAFIGIVSFALSIPFTLVGALVVVVRKLATYLLTTSDAGKRMLGRISDGFRDMAKTFAKSWEGITAAVQKGDLELAFQIASTGLRIEWEKVVIYWTQLWVRFKNGWLKDIREMATAVKHSFLGRTVAEIPNVIGKGMNHLTQGFRAVFKATGITGERIGIRGAPPAPAAPGGPAAPAPEDPLIAAANARLAALEVLHRELIAKAQAPGGPAGLADWNDEDAKRFAEHGIPPRPVLNLGEARGGFAVSNARQQFGYGDSFEKKQLDALKDIKDGKGKLAAKIGEAVLSGIVFG